MQENEMNRTRPTTRIAASVAALSFLLAACGDDDDDAGTDSTAVVQPTPTTSAATEDTGADAGDIVETATAAGDFTVLLEAATAAGLVDELQGAGPLTVFAPTDEAFAAALESLGLTKDELLADTETLSAILLYHVVDGAVPAADVVTLDGESVPTLNGAEVTVRVADGKVRLNDGAEVVTADVQASNGIIHVIDGVLLPPA
jgi:transforming growth factor-beta-induced protein